MKTRMKILGAMLGLVAVVATSCQQPEEVVVTPEFPTLIEANVEPGEVFKFTIKPNMDWRLNIPSEQYTYFKLLLDNGKKDLVQRGKAGEHEISVVVEEQTELDNSRVCDITLTMGEQTQTIVRLTKNKVERKAEVYVAKYDSVEENFVTNENGDLTYDEEANNVVGMIWDLDNQQWIQRIKVDANFKWSLRGIPEWMITNEVVGGTAGVTEIFIRVNRQQWPLLTAEYTLELCDMSTDSNGDGKIDNSDVIVVNSFTITLEGCKDVYQWEVGSQLNFNAEGLYYHTANYEYVENVHGVVVAPYGMEFRKLTYFNDRYWADEVYSEWVTMEMGEYPEGATAEKGIWSRNVTITAAPTQYTTARECKILMLPKAVSDALGSSNSSLVMGDLSDIAEEYKKYLVCTIKQAGTADAVLDAINAYTPDGMLASNALFEKLTSGTYPWTDKWATIPNGYKLTYMNNDSGDNLLFTTDWARYEVYAPNGNKYNNEKCWVTINKVDIKDERGSLYRVVMRLGTGEGEYANEQPTTSGGNEAIIIFYDANGTAFALLYFVEDAELDPYANIEAPIKFVNPQEAYNAGAKLERIKVGDDDYDSDSATRGVALYRLTCNSDYKVVELHVPSHSTAWDEYSQNKDRIKATSTTGVRLKIEVVSDESFTGRVTLFSGTTDVAQIIVAYQAK